MVQCVAQHNTRHPTHGTRPLRVTLRVLAYIHVPCMQNLAHGNSSLDIASHAHSHPHVVTVHAPTTVTATTTTPAAPQ